jgi:hypothetical protein
MTTKRAGREVWPNAENFGGLLEFLNYSFIGDWWVLSNFAKS